MYREYLTNKNEQYKRHINEYNKNIQKLIKEYKEHKWLTVCNEINQQQGRNYWQHIRKLSGYKRSSLIATLEEDDTQYNSNSEKADLFAEHFEKIYTLKNENQYDETHHEDIKNWHDNYFSEEITRRTML